MSQSKLSTRTQNTFIDIMTSTDNLHVSQCDPVIAFIVLTANSANFNVSSFLCSVSSCSPSFFVLLMLFGLELRRKDPPRSVLSSLLSSL